MPLFRIRFTPHFKPRNTPKYDLNAFKHNLTMATTQGKIDTATAIEHIHKAATLAAKEKHWEAARFIDQVHHSIGIESGHTFH